MLECDPCVAGPVETRLPRLAQAPRLAGPVETKLPRDEVEPPVETML